MPKAKRKVTKPTGSVYIGSVYTVPRHKKLDKRPKCHKHFVPGIIILWNTAGFAYDWTFLFKCPVCSSYIGPAGRLQDVIQYEPINGDYNLPKLMKAEGVKEEELAYRIGKQ